MIEAELKVRVADPEEVCNALTSMAEETVARYHDTYYDWPDGSLTANDQEVRLRTVDSGAGIRYLLTFKSAAVDEETQSKPEHETEVASAAAVDTILRGLGLAPWIAFEKQCSNFCVAAEGRKLLATLVRIPELDGMFLEVETMVDREQELAPALAVVRDFLSGLGIGEAEVTTDTYTGAVLRRRSQPTRGAADDSSAQTTSPIN